MEFEIIVFVIVCRPFSGQSARRALFEGRRRRLVLAARHRPEWAERGAERPPARPAHRRRALKFAT